MRVTKAGTASVHRLCLIGIGAGLLLAACMAAASRWRPSPRIAASAASPRAIAVLPPQASRGERLGPDENPPPVGMAARDATQVSDEHSTSGSKADAQDRSTSEAQRSEAESDATSNPPAPHRASGLAQQLRGAMGRNNGGTNQRGRGNGNGAMNPSGSGNGPGQGPGGNQQGGGAQGGVVMDVKVQVKSDSSTALDGRRRAAVARTPLPGTFSSD